MVQEPWSSQECHLNRAQVCSAFCAWAMHAPRPTTIHETALSLFSHSKSTKQTGMQHSSRCHQNSHGA